MATKKTLSTQKLRQFAETQENRVSDAFSGSVTELRAGVDIQALTEAIRNNDIEAAIAACDVEEAIFSRITTELQAIYAEAGQMTADAISPIPVRE